MSVNYIYLIHEREFIKTKENIYKIGRSQQEHNKRANQYPKQSVLLYQIICENCVKLEKILLQEFNTKFKKCKDIGNEYFEGNYEAMIDIINHVRKNINDYTINTQTNQSEKEILQVLKQQSKQEKLKQLEEEKILKKEAKQKLKEEKQKQLMEEKYNKVREKAKSETKPIMDWIQYNITNNTLQDDNVRKLYQSYLKFITGTSDNPVTELKFGLILNNSDNLFPFDIGYKIRNNSGCMFMKFDIPSIKKGLGID
jgi:hypothetical protein